ncbi:MAG: coproporphyrinogen III oxidase [Myxococcota bacterium]|jgi:coproporphyrinogen III oxidase
MNPAASPVYDYLSALQGRICDGLQSAEPDATFRADPMAYPNDGISRPRILSGGRAIEQAAVNFTHVRGDRLPPAATKRKPELAGGRFEAVSLSLIVHPRNPYAPTSHANLRFFLAQKDGVGAIWWFGGGYDLTPYYGFEADAVHWHETAKAATGVHYDHCKQRCDEYFHLPHRDEPRGIGGVFFDDWNAEPFADCLDFVKRVGDSYLPAYLPILKRRLSMDYGEREREWQLYRRGRYVEFNLLYDRGTKYGVQSGRRIESVLASMPPRVRWAYDHQPEPGSPEAALYADFLRPRDWADLKG